MINGVNFGAISTDPTIRLQDSTVAQTHNNAAPSTPTAATTVQSDSFEKKGKGKKVVGFIALVGAALAGLAYAVKSGKLTKVDDATKFLDKAKNVACEVGARVYTVATEVFERIQKLLPKTKEAASKVAE